MSDYDRLQNDNNYIAMRNLTKALNNKKNVKIKESIAIMITLLGIAAMIGIYII